MSLKKMIGLHAYWIINKELAKEIGIEATLLLQHLIDLREEFFKNGKPFYQQQKRLSADLGLSEYQVRGATKKLIEQEFISVERKGIPPKYEFTILDENLYRFFNLTYKDQKIEPIKVKKVDHKHKELTEHKELTNTNIDDVLGKIFFKIVELYPKDRIGNRQHGLKKFQQLDIEKAKLALKNLDQYLNLAGGYVKSLQNYIAEECYTEEWLSSAQRNKTQIKSISNKVETKTFNTNYDTFS